MVIKQSAEDYLETILILKKKLGNVRSIDVANELGVTKPSVSVAMKNFRQDNLIVMDEDNYIKLTDKGRKLAEDVYERHQIIAKALIKLGVSEETAYEDSCQIEHVISKESFDKIKEYVGGSQIG